MKRAGIKEAREVLPELVHCAEVGEEIVITRHGRAVAKLVAATHTPQALPSLKEFRVSLRARDTPADKLIRGERNSR